MIARVKNPRWRTRIVRDENGAVLVEGLIAIPVLVILTFGIIEFGGLMWQREQLQIGVRDAARFLSRCRVAGDFANCNVAYARSIAFNGDPRPGFGNQRVPGWGDDPTSDLVFSDDAPGPDSDVDSVLLVSGYHTYESSPVFGRFFGANLPISYHYTIRYIGW